MLVVVKQIKSLPAITLYVILILLFTAVAFLDLNKIIS